MFKLNGDKYAEGQSAFARGLALNLLVEQAQRDYEAIPSADEAEIATASLFLGYAGAALQCLSRVEGLLAQLRIPAEPGT